MLIDIRMYILIPLFRLTLQEGHKESDLVHILVKSLPMVVEIGLDVQDKPLHVVWIAIKRANIEPTRLLRLGLILLLQHIQRGLKLANLRVPREIVICLGSRIACR